MQQTSGTIGIGDTSITGNLIWNKISHSTDSSKDRDIILKLSFDNAHSFTQGKFFGDGQKDISFNGENAFDKQNLKISEENINSSYAFNNVGVIDSATLNNLLENTSLKEGSDKDSSDTLNAGNFYFDGTTVLNADISDKSIDNSLANLDKTSNQTIYLGSNSNLSPKGIEVRGKIDTHAKVEAKFGLGSKVEIYNKNKDSIYDFSALSGVNAPVVASIYLDTSDSTRKLPAKALPSKGSEDTTGSTAGSGSTGLLGSAIAAADKSALATPAKSTPSSDGTPLVDGSAPTTDGILKASIKGFDGTVSLIGSIQDSNQTLNDGNQADGSEGSKDIAPTQIKSSNTYKFGDWQSQGRKSSWLMVGNSNIADFKAYNNNTDEQNAALNASTFSNVGSVIDLRGTRAMSQPQILGGSESVNGFFNPQTLHIQKADLDRAIFRLGVDTLHSQADRVIIDTFSADQVAQRTSNILQVFLENGGTQVSTPILLAQINVQANPNFFKIVGSKNGLYDLTPIMVAKPLENPNPSEEPSSSDTNTSKASGDKSSPEGVAGATSALAGASSTPLGSAASSSTTPGENGWGYYLTGYLASANQAAVNTLSSSLGTFYRGFRVETNNLNLRMGELRDNPSSQGVWARVVNGMGSDKENNRDYYTTLQAGYDYQLQVLGGRNYIGVSADASMIASRGDGYTSSGTNLAIGLYDTYLSDIGFYVDAITKYINLGNRLSIKDSSILNNANSTLYSNAFLLGAEVGYRYSLDTLLKRYITPSNAIYTQGFYVEPQAELIYGYIGGSHFNVATNDNTIDANLSGSNALVSRIGAVLGKRFKTQSGFEADVRLGLSYINELNSGGNITLTQHGAFGSPVDVATPVNNKLNLSLGGNFKVNDDWRVYADISRTFLGVYNFDYNLNVGARFSFGQKVSALQKQIQEKKTQEKSVEEKQIQNQPKQDEPNKKEIEKKLIEEKQTIKLETKGAKVGCLGCLPEKGLYLQVAVLAKKDPSALKLISKQSYRAYELDLKIKSKTQKVTRYLVGPFKNIQEVLEHKKEADRIVQNIDKNPKDYAVMYVVE